jgi:hypothetical protein
VVNPDGTVVAHDPLGVMPDRFASRSIEQFTACLHLFAGAWLRRSGLSEPEANDQAEELRAELGQADPSAFADPGNWWAVVMEQLCDGMI